MIEKLETMKAEALKSGKHPKFLIAGGEKLGWLEVELQNLLRPWPPSTSAGDLREVSGLAIVRVDGDCLEVGW